MKTTLKNLAGLIFLILFTLTSLSAQSFDWLTRIASTKSDAGHGVAISTTGESYVVGNYSESALIGSGSSLLSLTSTNNKDGFIAKFNSSGQPVWAKSIASSNDLLVKNIVLSSKNYLYVIGEFVSSATVETTTLTATGWKEMFLAKYDLNGNLIWVKQSSAGSTHRITPMSLVVGGNDDIYISGYIEGSVDFGSLSIASSEKNDTDFFIVKYDENGNEIWAERGGAVGAYKNDKVNDISIDDNDNLYVVGEYNSLSYFGSDSIVPIGGFDVFVAKYDSSGAYVWVKSFGKNYFEKGNGIVYGNQSIFITGQFNTASKFGNINLTANNDDIFIVKLDASNGNVNWAESAGGINYEWGNDVAVDVNNNVYITGGVGDQAYFGSTLVRIECACANNFGDVFVAKYSSNGVFQWVLDAGVNPYTDEGFGISVSENGKDVYFTGIALNNAEFGSFTLDGFSANQTEGFISKVGVGPNSIKDYDKDNYFKLYPNPVRNQLIINNRKIPINEINIIDLTGKTLKTILSNLDVISVTDLAEGIYFLKIKTKAGIVIKKFIKQ